MDCDCGSQRTESHQGGEDSGFLSDKLSQNALKAEDVEAVKKISEEIGKTPVQVEEAAGFVVNRILIPMVNEAVGIYAEGVASVNVVSATGVIRSSWMAYSKILADCSSSSSL